MIANVLTTSEDTFPHRTYIDLPGFGHLLGYVSYPAKDSNGIYWQEKIIGKDGVEKQFNQELAGTNGLKILETDAFGNAQSENILDKPKMAIILSLPLMLIFKVFYIMQSKISLLKQNLKAAQVSL